MLALQGCCSTSDGSGQPLSSGDSPGSTAATGTPTVNRSVTALGPTIQPQFDREQGSAAWVVPFSVLPYVNEGNAELFDHLELATAPVFIDECRPPYESGCGGSSKDSVGASAIANPQGGGQSSVTVWQRGQVGTLDYVVLSTTDGDDLAAWLAQEGFDLPPPAEPILDDLQAEGVFFFVSRLAPDADPTLPIAPVRFVLPGLDEPSYPLRLTALGAPAGEVLDVTLWVIYPFRYPSMGYDYLPANRELLRLDDRPPDANAYRAAVDALFQRQPQGVALLYAEPFRESDTMDQMVCRGSCLAYEEVGLEAPESWCPEFSEMHDSGVKLLRLEARLNASAMTTDLQLAKAGDGRLRQGRVHGPPLRTCDDDGGCSASGSRREANLAWAMAAVGIGLLALARQRRRRCCGH